MMAKVHAQVTDRLEAFTAKQHIFFVATAPHCPVKSSYCFVRSRARSGTMMPVQTRAGRDSMATYVLLCNYTDQGIRAVKDSPKRRAAAKELGKKFGVELKTSYLAMGTCDVILTVEATSDDAVAKWALSLASKGNVRTTTIKVFPEAEMDKILESLG